MDIRESMQQVLEREQILADLFYDVFLDRHPDVRHYFAEVDLRRQAVLLTMALVVMEHHYGHRYPATEMYLKYLGTMHKSRGIPHELFPKFRDALLETLERFHGSDWHGQLAAQWQQAIDLAAATMLEGYREHFTV